uniref:Uncharacterized protein n=1 Tax=Tetranychus urticae TaxID=32264 RepID=T1JVW6_TETUR
MLTAYLRVYLNVPANYLFIFPLVFQGKEC